jgi:hypothetical protein
MSYGLLDTLIPSEPIVRGFNEPRLVSFADVDDKDESVGMGKEARGILLQTRVRRVREAMRALGGKCTSDAISKKTGLYTSVVSRVLQYMRNNGMVKSTKRGAGMIHDWELVEKKQAGKS